MGSISRRYLQELKYVPKAVKRKEKSKNNNNNVIQEEDSVKKVSKNYEKQHEICESLLTELSDTNAHLRAVKNILLWPILRSTKGIQFNF